MKTHYFALCLLPLVLYTALAGAVDSTITITGYMRDNMCRVDASSQNMTVDLQASSSTQLYQVGEVSAYPAAFSILLSPCGSYATGVKVGFTGTADNDNTTLLQIDGGSGAAAGMGLQILDGNKNAIPLNQPSASQSFTPLVGGQPNRLNYYARLMATRKPVTAGTVNATATFTLEFE